MDRPFKELGERIRQVRTAKRLTQQDIADALNISVQSVSQWETGRNQPELDRLIALADILGRHWDWLKTGADHDGGLVVTPLGRTKDQQERFAPLTTLEDLEGFLNASRPALPEQYDEETVICRNPGVGRLFSFYAPDDSLAPAVREGDLIICDTGVAARTGDYIVAREWVDETMLFVRVLGIQLGSEDKLKATLGTGASGDKPIKIDMKDDLDRIFGVMVEQRRFRFR